MLSKYNKGIYEAQIGLTLCGGINPYTLAAKLGLARIDGFSPPER